MLYQLDFLDDEKGWRRWLRYPTREEAQRKADTLLMDRETRIRVVETCPDCKGMGFTVSPHRDWEADTCETCAGAGALEVQP